MKPWILAARPKTLPAAIAPVLLGTALALRDDAFLLLPALAALTFALLIQIGTNYANDYFDFVKGADTAERIGPARAVASGWVTPRAMAIATALVFGLAFVAGLVLVPYGGWWLVWVGVASVVCGIAYTGGPYPLGYNGWGDVFVFIFFGLIAVSFTYYVQAGQFTPDAFLLGVVPGALASNILMVNNYRDVETDRVAGKRTLVVRFGRNMGFCLYVFNLALALVVPVILAIRWENRWIALPVAMAFSGIRVARSLRAAETRKEFDRALAQTAAFMLAYSLLLAILVGSR